MADSGTAMNPAWGPPKPRGTPKRCDDPTTASAPSSPGGVSRHIASRSVATATRALTLWAAAMIPLKSPMRPELPGYDTSTPNAPSAISSMSACSKSATTTSMPSGSALVVTTSMVWGWVSASTMNRFSGALRLSRRSSVMASAAAVPSSSSEALAMPMAHRSVTMVWKLISASRRPWEISGWYGV